MVIISIEGNIGSGKSTLVKKLAREMGEWFPLQHIIFLQEPVDVWNTVKDKNGVTILENFYKNQEKYAFSFQMMAYISRLSLLKKTVHDNPNSIIICERSMHTDKEVFAKMLHDDGKIDIINYTIYNKWFDEFIDDIPLNGIIYIRTDPAICQERINIRNREGEMIPPSYSQKCHDYHESWINNSGVSILKLDGNIEFKKRIPDSWKGNIYTFITDKKTVVKKINWNETGYY